MSGTQRRLRAGRSPSGAAARAAGVLAALVLLGCGAEASERPEPAGTTTGVDRDVRQRSEPSERRERGAKQRRSRWADVADPRRIEIPAIAVSAPVIELGLNPDGTLEVPTDYGDAGWWKRGAKPGERGAAVIAGHVDSRTGPAVFYRLAELRPGDEIRVRRADGSQARFLVRRLERHPKDDFPTERVYGHTAEPTLRLVTCSGDFDTSTGHYVDNTIVFADAD